MVLILVALIFSLFPTEVRAGLTDLPTAWSNFVWQPYLYNGSPIYDYESNADPSGGGGAISPPYVDISSGAASGIGPGTQPSVLLAYYNGGTPGDASYADDFYAFRLRLNADNEFRDGYQSGHWDVLLDIDSDGYKEFSTG